MTGLHETLVARDANSREFHREQLSAMMDGALSTDEARFLLRRMEHDDELADCWERWQFVGDAMRGNAGRALPADFSRRVGRAIADDVGVDGMAEEQSFAMAAAPGARRPLLRWGGGAALAASVALAALIGSRALLTPEDAPLPAVATAPVPVPEVSVPVPKPVLPAGAAEAGAAAIAAAAVATRDNRTDRTGRAARPHLLAGAQAVPAGRSTATVVAAKPQVAASSQVLQIAKATHGRDLAPNADMTGKPWPRALVPGASAGGEVTAGFEGSPAFQPFQTAPQPPRLDWLPPNAAQPQPAEAAAPSP